MRFELLLGGLAVVLGLSSEAVLQRQAESKRFDVAASRNFYLIEDLILIPLLAHPGSYPGFDCNSESLCTR